MPDVALHQFDDPLLAQVQERAMAFARANLPDLVDVYLEKFGNAINSDSAKELFPEYASIPDRARLSPALHDASSIVSEAAASHLLATESLGRKLVMFTAGGPGSGKSTVVSLMPDERRALYTVIRDANFAFYDPSRRKVEEFLEKGWSVCLTFVLKDFSDAVNGVIDRSLSEKNGRTVPLNIVAENHFESRRTFVRLAEEFQGHPSVLVDVRVSDRFSKNFLKGDIESIRATIPESIDVFQDMAYSILDHRMTENLNPSAHDHEDHHFRTVHASLSTGRQPLPAGVLRHDGPSVQPPVPRLSGGAVVLSGGSGADRETAAGLRSLRSLLAGGEVNLAAATSSAFALLGADSLPASAKMALREDLRGFLRDPEADPAPLVLSVESRRLAMSEEAGREASARQGRGRGL